MTNHSLVSNTNITKNLRRAALVACTMLAVAACGKKNDSNAPSSTDAPTVDTTTSSGDTGEPGTTNNPKTPGGTPAAGAPSASGAVTATDAGQTMTLSKAAYYASSSDPTGAKQYAFSLTDYDYCDWAAAHDPGLYPKQTHANLAFYLVPKTGASSSALKPGVYTVGKGAEMAIPVIGFTGYTAECKAPWPQVSGTVTVESVAGNVVKGSVDLKLQDNDGVGQGTIKGAFTTVPCTGTEQKTPPANDPEACPASAPAAN